MRLTILALILTSFALVNAADENPYEVTAPKTADTTVKTPPKVEAPITVVDTPATKAKPPTATAKDSTAAAKKKARLSKAAAKKDSAAAQSVKVDTTAKIKKDSITAPVGATRESLLPVNTPLPVDTVAAKRADTTTAKTDTASRKARPRIVRETTINTLNEMKGRYRSPKQALFMSLIIPGLGQAYVGQTKFNYIRAAAYFSADIVLGAFWYDYVVIKHDREVKNYHRFADTYWSQTRYEDSVTQHSSDHNVFVRQNPARETYCNAVTQGTELLNACKDPSSPQYSGSFLPSIQTFHTPDSVERTSAYRAGFPSPFDFYSVIGQEREFISGWQDATVQYGDSAITGTSAYLDRYIAMRAQANKYARMQAWFLGGIVLNHIASALDAALTARYHNRVLYETESMWFDRLHFDGGLAFDQGWPKTNFTASLSF